MIIYDCNYLAIDEKTVVRLFIKDGDKNIIIYDDSLTPYIYAVPKIRDAKERIMDIIKVSNENVVKVESIGEVRRKLKNEEINVLKVNFRFPFDVPELRNEISNYADIYEYDIPFARRYLLDKKIPVLAEIEAETETRDGREYLKKIKKVYPAKPDFRILSLDIETYCKKRPDAKKDPIIMISVAENNFSKVFSWKDGPGAIKFADERSMLAGFFSFLDSYSPQIIVTYNGDNFDLPFIKKRCEINGISHPFVSRMKIKSRGQFSSAEILGIAHIDLFPIIKKTINLARYTLENVYKEFLGKEKSKIDGSKIWQYWDDPDLLPELVRYSREDAIATFEIGGRILPLEYEMTKLVDQRIFDVSRASSSSLVEWLLIKRCQENEEIVPNPPSGYDFARRSKETYAGAYVVEPIKGLHDNIFYFDFRSLYPSIIINHNVDPNTLGCSCCKENTSPSGHNFCLKQKGFIPAILEQLLKKRLRIKDKMNKSKDVEFKVLYSQQWALKILANSFYGYMGYPRSRWYSKESAESITAWGRMYINDVISKAKNFGFKVVYGDTDSLFVSTLGKDLEKAERFLVEINSSLPQGMELEMEGFYKRGVFVTKKKYALIDKNDKIVTKGLEVVRRDWAKIAKKTQKSVLDKILKEGDMDGAIELVRDVTKKLKEKKIPLEDLVINTQITMPLAHYKAIGPHVQVARKLKEKGEDIRVGTIISYVVLKGSGKVRDKAVSINEYSGEEIDADYYIKNQVLPPVKRILEPLGYTEEELEYSKTSQANLEGWF
ncbi:MAG: DNA-directed DNA polymerase [Candidatus Methanofastidiosia archaeon]